MIGAAENWRERTFIYYLEERQHDFWIWFSC
jgi:hypothetical protein